MKEEDRRDRGDRGDRGDRNDRGDRGDRGGDDRQERGFHRRKGCRFCADKTIILDHKDKNILWPLLTERHKIVPRRISGCCAKHQRQLTLAIKRGRHLAIVPYTTAQLW